jgi:putative two-component system response regulator
MRSTSERKAVLIVDDAPTNIRIINSLLQREYATRVAVNGAKALELVFSEHPPDLVLLDIMMPGMNGYEVCAAIKAERATREIPIIFLTGKTEVEDELRGFQLGAADYITKPVCPAVLLARVKSQLDLTEARNFLQQQNRLLEDQVLERTRDSRQVQEATMIALGSLAESRDNAAGNHIRRTQCYIRELATKLQDHSRFKNFLDDRKIESIFKSAALHDIGKVGIPDRILLKPGRLTVEEFEVIKTHTRLGRDTIASAERQLDNPSDFLTLASEIAYCHHERWDGTGYPEGLAGEAIPAGARLMAVADVYDALTSKRVYRDAYSHEQAVEMVEGGRASHFDPAVVEAFIGLADDFPALAQRYCDSEEAVPCQALYGSDSG